MSRAADIPERLLQPYDMLELVPRLAAMAKAGRERGVTVTAANNLGYFGPHETDLRGGHYVQGCGAGRYSLGIESNGDIKGCPSLASTPYVGGNVRPRSLQDLWDNTAELRFARDRTTDELWGHCKTCYYADVCRGGCSWTAHTLLGRRGSIPYCFHRADLQREQGIREGVERVEKGPG
jgi:radical SAM protein with 4Fe4S-binding SPASM domain